MEQQKIRLKLKSFESELLDGSVKDIIEIARKTGAKVKGPIPLPTKISRFTVLRSPHGKVKALADSARAAGLKF